MEAVWRLTSLTNKDKVTWSWSQQQLDGLSWRSEDLPDGLRSLKIIQVVLMKCWCTSEPGTRLNLSDYIWDLHLMPSIILLCIVRSPWFRSRWPWSAPKHKISADHQDEVDLSRASHPQNTTVNPPVACTEHPCKGREKTNTASLRLYLFNSACTVYSSRAAGWRHCNGSRPEGKKVTHLNKLCH